MPRLILLLAIAILAWLIYRAYVRRKATSNRTGRKMIPRQMIRCAYCGLHVLEDQIVTAQERPYCSEEHRRLGEKGPGD